jgi:ribulose-5-phosphate 4-epimerase/fuculose-1-phosphate aldolase
MTNVKQQQEFRRYRDKLQHSGLVDPSAPLFGLLDTALVWNRPASRRPVLEKVFANLNINALLWARPAEPYRTLIDYLARSSNGTVFPQDTETRTFMHDLPVARRFDATEITDALRRRKSVIVPGHGIATFGTVGLEQAYVAFTCVCFACFVKFFSDYLQAAKRGSIATDFRQAFERVRAHLDPQPAPDDDLRLGPFTETSHVMAAMEEAGQRVVAKRLVDAFFGNISYRSGNTLYISQTGSSLDALKGCIDACPLDDSSCVSITASSEYPTHRRIVQLSGHRALLHGHPKFAVILSMDCDVDDCPGAGDCHRRCPRERLVDDIPVVAGEVGSGPYGLVNTVPPVLVKHAGAIVYGHGVFSAGDTDFNLPLEKLVEIENTCRTAYFRRLGGL